MQAGPLGNQQAKEPEAHEPNERKSQRAIDPKCQQTQPTAFTRPMAEYASHAKEPKSLKSRMHPCSAGSHGDAWHQWGWSPAGGESLSRFPPAGSPPRDPALEEEHMSLKANCAHVAQGPTEMVGIIGGGGICGSIMWQSPPEAVDGPGTRQTFDKHVKPSAGKGSTAPLRRASAISYTMPISRRCCYGPERAWPCCVH